MNNNWIARTVRISLIGVVLVMIGLLAYQQRVGAEAAGATRVEQAWNNIRLSASYAFSGDAVIKTIPLPTVGNIGRFSKTDSLYLEGNNDLRRNNLQLALWGGAVSAADSSTAYQMRIKDGRTETRAGDGAWQASDSADLAFAPEGDFLAFLDFAKDIVYVGDEMVGRQQVAKYSFAIDGSAYADRLRQITQERLVANRTLPRGAAVQAPAHLAQMTGQGELWVDARGLPLREIIRLQIPAVAGADYRTEAELSVHFTKVEGLPAASVWGQAVAKAGLALQRLNLPSPAQATGNLGLMAATLLLALLVARPKRRTLVVVHVAVAAILIVGPLARTGVISAEADQIAAYQAQVEQTAAQTANTSAASVSQANVPQPLVPLKSLDLRSSNSSADSDNDGLTDEIEDRIGTSPLNKDTDLDGISDYDEVAGFVVGGQRWYGNPMWPDTNRDGVIDGLEWNLTTPDRDGDGTPDLYDFDDDGDGVPDDSDISRLTASKDNAGNLVAFNQANPLNLTISGLQANRYTYVSVQLRPTNPDHLWYAFNVMNWPKDEKGNMQDWDNKTLFDYCVATGGSNCNMTPDANGDIKLVPMLEVQLNDLSSLPRTTGGALDTQLLAKYSISVQPAGNGGYYVYVPLNLVEDKDTGQKVAFSAQLLYQTGATWQPQQVRLSWGVQVLNEQYANPDAYAAVTNKIAGNKLTILHAYYNDFYLTGLNVREDRGVEMAIVYEDPATDPDVTEDDALVHMMSGLDRSFLVNRDCDLTDNQGYCIGDGQRDITIPVIKQRWDRLSNSGATSGQRWGIAQNRLRVETHSFAHEDEATMVAGGQYAPAILNTHFSGTAATKPSLLFVREARFRASNIDMRAGSNSNIAWTGRNVQVNLTDVPEMITGGYTLSPYRYVSNSWVRQTSQEYLAELENRYPLAQSNPGSPPAVPVEQQSAIVIITMGGTTGSEQVLSQNGATGLGSALTSNGAIRLQAADIRDEDLRRVYEQALASAGKAVPYLAMDAMLKNTGLSRQAWKELNFYIVGNMEVKGNFIFTQEQLNVLDKKLAVQRAMAQGDINRIARFGRAMVGPMLS